jgi:hypothetical protein
MQSRNILRRAGCAILLAAACFATLAAAQTAPSNPPSSDNDTWLAQTAKLYYSSSKAGLKGFDCTVKTDWQALYATQNGNQVSAADGAKVALLNSVQIAYHARMDSGATVDWNPPDQQLDASQTTLLKDMHDALNQTLTGFMQFWTPFVESSVIPESPDGLEMTTTDDGGKKIHLQQPTIELTESFDSSRVLRQYNIVMEGTKIDVTPTYSADSHGLLISHFHALLSPMNDPAKVQDMSVDVSYQWLDGFPIPAHLFMGVAGVANLNVTFENCTVQH